MLGSSNVLCLVSEMFCTLCLVSEMKSFFIMTSSLTNRPHVKNGRKYGVCVQFALTFSSVYH